MAFDLKDNTKEEQTKMVCYVDFLNKDKKYKEDRKDFSTYEEAWKWILETFDKPDRDLIGYY